MMINYRYYKNYSFCQYTYPIAVSARSNGSKVIIDGQHRVYAAIQTGKSLFAIYYYGLSLEEEMTIYFINNITVTSSITTTSRLTE